MTGLDPARAEALPRNPGARCEVAVQAGHLCAYGAPVSTAVELAGGTVRGVGQSTLAMDHQLRAALGPQTAAGLYVVSHHVVRYGQIPFGRFTEICQAAGVPVIVDAASEHDLRGFIAAGADLAIYAAVARRCGRGPQRRRDVLSELSGLTPWPRLRPRPA